MKKPFQVGDRVLVYATINGASVCSACTVKQVENHRLEVASDFKVFWAHPKQCRRIKPKKKPREFWLGKLSNGTWQECTHETSPRCYLSREIIHVREIFSED